MAGAVLGSVATATNFHILLEAEFLETCPVPIACSQDDVEVDSREASLPVLFVQCFETEPVSTVNLTRSEGTLAPGGGFFA